MSAITTHILDTSAGTPASGVAVRLERMADGAWQTLGEGVTDDDGRNRELLQEPLVKGTYRMTFVTGPYLERTTGSAFYPEAQVVFSVDGNSAHYHIPLLLSPFGYSTYRGS